MAEMGKTLFWILLILTVAGEFVVPWLLAKRVPGYDARRTAISALGGTDSPVKRWYNGWLIWLGCFLSVAAVVFFLLFWEQFPVLAGLMLASILIFAWGAGLLAGLFPVNSDKTRLTRSARIHGIGSAIGFFALLFFPLWMALAMQGRQPGAAVLCLLSFLLAVGFFVLFVLSDHERFRGTVIAYEGLWERLALLAMYLPFLYQAGYCLMN